MELFRINDGPWEKLFEGMFEQNPVEIYSNTQSILLVLIFEKRGSEIDGVVIDLYKIFSVTGAVEGFIESLPREIILLVKHDKKQTNKFLMISSSPSYSEWKEEPFSHEIDSLLKKLETSAIVFKDIAKAYDLELEEISKATLKVKKSFFSDPLLVSAVSSTNSVAQESSAAFVRGDFFVGLTKERQSIVEPLELFTKTLVSGGERNERMHFLHVLLESFLLANTSALVFDLTNSFRGLNSPTTNLDELQKYKVDYEPIGFPLKIFRLAQDVKVDLNYINPEGFAQTFGIGKNSVAKIIEATLLKTSVSGVDDFVEKLKFTKITEEITDFEVKRTARILRLVGNAYPGLFEGKNNIEEMTTSGTKTLGKAAIIELSGAEPKIALLVVQNILGAVLRQRRESGAPNERSLVVMPEINSFMAGEMSIELEAEIGHMLKNLEAAGVGFAMSEDHEVDSTLAISNLADAKANIIAKNDAGIQLKGRKSYRVFVRPALSVCSEN